MKRKIYTLILSTVVILFAACSNEEDDLFSSSAAERLEQGAEEAAAKLISSPGGWAMEYYPTDDTEEPYGLGYLMVTKFNADGSTVVGMNNYFSNNVYLEDTSAWEIITDDGVVLTYNTYNACMHSFSAPENIASTNPYVNETGYGCEGDYEFIVAILPEEDEPEYIMLKGKKRGVYIRLSRLEPGTVFEEYMDDVLAFNEQMFSSSAPNSLYLTMGSDYMQVDDIATGIPTIYEYGTDAVTNGVLYPYLVTKHNGKYYLRFRDEVVSPTGFGIQELVYDASQDCFVGVDDETMTLGGPDPAMVCISQMEEGNAWRLRRSSDMSTAGEELYEKIYSDFSAAGRTLEYITLQIADGQLTCAIHYSSRSGSVTRSGDVTYCYAYTQTDGNVNLTYVGPKDSAAESILSSIPSVGELIDLLKGDNGVAAAVSKLNLSDIRWTTTQADTWFVFSLM